MQYISHIQLILKLLFDEWNFFSRKIMKKKNNLF